MVTAKSFRITFDWARYWLATIGVTSTLYGHIQSVQLFFLIGVALVALAVGCNGFSRIAKQFEGKTDDYAATIHRSMVEQYFIKSTNETKLADITPEFVTRTTFARPNQYAGLHAFYQTTTYIVLISCIAIGLKLITGSIGVVLFALALAGIYVTDIVFGLRSVSYFAVQDRIENPNTTHPETITEMLSSRLDIRMPDIHYIDSETLIAGAINPIFSRPQLYLSQNVLNKQQHIQTGIIAHELAHMYADEGQRTFSHRYIQLLMPTVLVLFAYIELTAISVIGLWIVFTLLAMTIAAQRHREEFFADELATSLTKTEFIILAILELTPHNPFVDELPTSFEVLSKISNTHPPSSTRIQRLVNQSERE